MRRHLDLSGLAILQTDSTIKTVCAFLKHTLAKSSTICSIALPTSVVHPSWDLSWLGSVPRLQCVDLNGSSFQTLKSRGLRMSVLCPLHTIRLKLTDDAPTQHKEHLTSLRDVSVAFGHGQRAPAAESLTALLCTWTDITRLKFTFAQGFLASRELIEAIAGLDSLNDLQINSFDISHLAADELLCMSQLTCLQSMELSGMNMVGERCVIGPCTALEHLSLGKPPLACCCFTHKCYPQAQCPVLLGPGQCDRCCLPAWHESQHTKDSLCVHPGCAMSHESRGAYRFHPWLPHLSSLTQLTLALTFPSKWELLLPTSLKRLEISNILHEEWRCPSRVLLDLIHLTCLNINCVRGVDDIFLRKLRSMPALKTCSLQLTHITGRAFKHIYWEHLTYLSVGSLLDGTCLMHIGVAFPSLKDLRIVHCHNV